MNILCVGSELAPFAKTGGLADVMAALPRHLARAGHDVRVVVPLYDKIDRTKVVFEKTPAAVGMTIPLGGHRYQVDILRAAGETPRIYFVQCPALYARGSIYTSDDDEHLRYLTLCMAALFLCERIGFVPDIVHCNDWQTALLPLLIRSRAAGDPRFARTRTLLTIHNLNYQGIFSAAAVADTGIPRHLFHQDQLRAGRVNFLLHGIMYADGVNTVSPTYAAEIQTADHGVGLDFFLRARSSTVVGILNGVDYDEWSPEHDRHIPHRYSADDLAGKERNKEALLTQLGLPYLPNVPVIGIVSRLAGQKGFNLFPEVMPDLLRRHGFQLVVLGSGDPALQELFNQLQAAFPRQVCFFKGFSEPLAHLIEAGSDMFLMPSRYEPCGLNQMYSLRYGTVPIVHRTGGLADTVTPWDPHAGEGTGFLFEHHDAAGLRWAVETALAAYRDRRGWRRLMLNGMAEDFSWDKQRKLYELVYARLSKDVQGR